jgi:hypothetical protein
MTSRTLMPLWPDWSDRGPATPAIEDTSESAWEEYNSCWHELDRKVPARPVQGGRQSAAQLRAAEREITIEPPDRLDVDEAMKIARRNHRVCPVGRAWRELYRLLPVRQMGQHVMRAPYPIDSCSRQTATHLDKVQRLRSQLQWAEAEGALPRVVEFLASLPEQDWEHIERVPAYRSGAVDPA